MVRSLHVPTSVRMTIHELGTAVFRNVFTRGRLDARIKWWVARGRHLDGILQEYVCQQLLAPFKPPSSISPIQPYVVVESALCQMPRPSFA